MPIMEASKISDGSATVYVYVDVTMRAKITSINLMNESAAGIFKQAYAFCKDKSGRKMLVVGGPLLPIGDQAEFVSQCEVILPAGSQIVAAFHGTTTGDNLRAAVGFEYD